MEKSELKNSDYVLESRAIELTGYERTRLYQFRKDGTLKWTSAKSGRKVRYHVGSLRELIGIKN